MSLVNPQEMRSTITKEAQGLKIVIPSKMKIFLVLFLSIWLIGWVVGEFTAINLIIRKDVPAGGLVFMLFWLCGWTLGGLFFLYVYFWQLFGKEIVIIDKEILSIKRDIFGFGKVKEFDINKIINLRVSPEPGSSIFDMSLKAAKQFWVGGDGIIAFDYGAKTLRFGAGIDEAEGKIVIESITEKHDLSENINENNINLDLIKSMRSTITKEEKGFNIVIPAKKKFYTILLLSVIAIEMIGLPIYLLIEIKRGSANISGDPELIPYMLSLLVFISLFSFYALFWRLFGKERIHIDGERISIKRDLFGRGKTREYELSETRNLRVSHGSSFGTFSSGFVFGVQSFLIGSGIIAFDYGAKTLRFGIGIEEAEGNIITEMIKAAFLQEDMPPVRPEKMKSTITEDDQSLKVTIPVKKNYIVIALISLYLTLGVPEFVFQIIKEIKSNGVMSEHMIIPLCFSVLFILFLLFIIIKQLFRNDIVCVNEHHLSVKRDYFGLGRTRRYDICKISNMRVSPSSSFNVFASDFFPGIKYLLGSGGIIAFDYGSKTYRFGTGIEEAEANIIVEMMNEKYEQIKNLEGSE